MPEANLDILPRLLNGDFRIELQEQIEIGGRCAAVGAKAVTLSCPPPEISFETQRSIIMKPDELGNGVYSKVLFIPSRFEAIPSCP